MSHSFYLNIQLFNFILLISENALINVFYNFIC